MTPHDGSWRSAAGVAVIAGAASCYEGETITLVVSFSPGGGYDMIARAVASHLEKELGATVVVVNQTGVGG